MKGIILAAGRGSRMQSQTEAQPKCLVKLKGKPLLHYQLNSFNQAGIKDIGVVTGYLNHTIKDQRISQKWINSTWDQSNMVRSLMTAHEWLSTETCIVSYGDIFYQSSAINLLMESSGDLAITYDSHFQSLWQQRSDSPLDDLETFRFSNNQLIEIGNKPKDIEEIQGQYMGLLKFTPQNWQQIYFWLKTLPAEEVNRLDMTSLLRHLLKQGMIIQVVAYEEPWGEVDNPTDLALYEAWDRI